LLSGAPVPTEAPKVDPPKTKEQEAAEAKAAADKVAADAKVKAETDAKALVEAEAKKPSLEKLKVPANTLISPEMRSEIVKTAKTAEEAQSILESQHGLAVRLQMEGAARLKSQGDNWRSELQKDPELGGANYQETDRLYTLGVKRIFGEGFINQLKALHVEANPDFVRGVVKAARNLEPDGIIHGTRPDPPKPKPRSPEEIAYKYSPENPYNPFKGGPSGTKAPSGM
jgi:hypothetical protein